VRELALSVLASRKDPAALEAAIAGVSGDRNLALVSVRALGSFGAEAVGPLARAMRHLDSDVRHTAASTLARSGQPAAREALALALRDPDRKTRRVAADAILQGSAAERTPEILAELAALSAPDPVDERLRAQLLRAGDRAVDPLARLLGDEEPTVRLTATKLLGDLKQRSALRPLAGMVNDPNPHVRKAAAEALSRLGEPAALPPIRGAVEDGNPEVREAATAALGRCGGAEASEPLARAIRHADWHMRALAASGLGLARPGQTLAPLVEALTDPHWYVRQKAADALTRIGATSEVPALMRALEDDHWSVRRNVLSALREITGQTLSADVSEWKAWLANEPGRPGFQPSGKELE
jgi:HEAT repeat protein